MDRYSMFVEKKTILLIWQFSLNFSINSMQFLQNLSYTFYINWKVVPKVYMEMRSTIIDKVVLKKNKVGVLMLPFFKTYHKPLVIKAVWYWHKDRHSDQWSKVDAINKPSHWFFSGCQDNWRGRSSLFKKWH